LSGWALASATSSRALFAGSEVVAASTNGRSANCAMGVKAVSGL
jgi:hypothetical protein